MHQCTITVRVPVNTGGAKRMIRLSPTSGLTLLYPVRYLLVYVSAIRLQGGTGIRAYRRDGN